MHICLPSFASYAAFYKPIKHIFRRIRWIFRLSYILLRILWGGIIDLHKFNGQCGKKHVVMCGDRQTQQLQEIEEKTEHATEFVENANALNV